MDIKSKDIIEKNINGKKQEFLIINHGFDSILFSLSKSKFRASFNLSKKERDYIYDKGLPEIRKHAEDFVEKRLASAFPLNDGKQTPFAKHPVFKAQHGTACCCRGCLYKWHGIEKGRKLSSTEKEFIVNLLMEWIKRKLI